MSNTEDIVSQVDQQSPGLLDAVAEEDDLSKEELVRKILSISHGHTVRTHQNKEARCADAPASDQESA